MLDSNPLFFEEIEIGRVWVSATRTITEADIAIFADLTGDRAPMHMDDEFARTTPFQRRIAHGLLGLALSSGLSIDSPPIRTQAIVGLREWNFRAPIFIGDTIRVRLQALEKELRGRGRRGAVVWATTVVNQDGRVVQDGISLTLVECAAARSAVERKRSVGEAPDQLREAG